MRDLTGGGRILAFLAAGLLIASLISLAENNSGAIRTLDFIREPMIYFAAVLLVLVPFVMKTQRLPVAAMLAASIAIDLWRIWPYSFLAPAEMPLSSGPDQAVCVKVLSFNVLQSNEEYSRTAELIERVDPDILFLTETNETWISALEPQLSRYGFRFDMPLENKYGKAFATRLEVEKAEYADTFSDEAPTLYATLRAENGARLELIGLHPRPPVPGKSTAKRDASIAEAGSETPDGLANALTIGDFNDVPWSQTTENFKEIGEYLDPRIGRGSYATFPASYSFVGWPLDQIFVKGAVSVESFGVGDNIGSDHLPLMATVCIAPDGN